CSTSTSSPASAPPARRSRPSDLVEAQVGRHLAHGRADRAVRDDPACWAAEAGAVEWPFTPVGRVEARCAWCRRWGHPAGLYYRQVLFTATGALVCGRHVRREDWREV